LIPLPVAKKTVTDDPKPTADKRKSSKTNTRKSGYSDGISDAVITGNKTTHSQVLNKASDSQLAQMHSKAKNAKLAKLKTPLSPLLIEATARTKPTSGKRKSSLTTSPGLHNTTKRKLALLQKKKEEARKGSPKRVLFKEVVSLVKTTAKVGGNASRDKEGACISKKPKKT